MALFGLLTVGLGMVGLALLLWGWRGRRVGDHPHCRACGFDLFGLAEDTAGCPECGHDLTRPRASVRGARQRRKGALAVGGMLVIVTGALVGLSTWQQTSKATLYANAPSFYLVWALPDPLARDELSNRLNNGNLSTGMTKRVVDRALDVQGDPARTWDDAWGGFIEDAHGAGFVSQAQIERYAKQAVTPLALKVRPKVQRGREPDGFVGTDLNNRRLGPNTEIEVMARLAELQIDGDPVELRDWLRQRAARFDLKSNGSSSSSTHLPLEKVGVRLGRVPIEAEVSTELSVAIAAQSVAQKIALPAQRLNAHVEVVEGYTGDYLRDEIAPADQARRAGVWIEDSPRGRPGRHLIFAVREQPDRVRTKSWLRVGNKVVPLSRGGHGHWRDGSGEHHHHQRYSLERFFRKHPEFEGEAHVDLIVRADVDAAETEVADRPMWLGEWVFEDVPLDAEPVQNTPDLSRVTELPTLVPARARVLTLEEAERPPSARRTHVEAD